MMKLQKDFILAMIFSFAFFSATSIQAGEPLPAGGGEPGIAYLAFLKSIEDGNLQEYKRYTSPADTAGLTEEIFSKGLPILRSMSITSAKVIDGILEGDRAILNVEGIQYGQEKPSPGKVTMKKTPAGWIHEKGEWDIVIE